MLIVRGRMGYHPVASPYPAEQLNATLPRPPSPAEIEAMLAGSMFGWDVPGADPARHATPAHHRLQLAGRHRLQAGRCRG